MEAALSAVLAAAGVASGTARAADVASGAGSPVQRSPAPEGMLALLHLAESASDGVRAQQADTSRDTSAAQPDGAVSAAVRTAALDPDDCSAPADPSLCAAASQTAEAELGTDATCLMPEELDTVHSPQAWQAAHGRAKSSMQRSGGALSECTVHSHARSLACPEVWCAPQPPEAQSKHCAQRSAFEGAEGVSARDMAETPVCIGSPTPSVNSRVAAQVQWRPVECQRVSNPAVTRHPSSQQVARLPATPAASSRSRSRSKAPASRNRAADNIMRRGADASSASQHAASDTALAELEGVQAVPAGPREELEALAAESRSVQQQQQRCFSGVDIDLELRLLDVHARRCLLDGATWLSLHSFLALISSVASGCFDASQQSCITLPQCSKYSVNSNVLMSVTAGTCVCSHGSGAMPVSAG
jgi:hypothetical protein